ncbi:hypothetical protein BJI62_08510 [Acinetobacter pittii]|nr:hypothetical protein BJI62_08510 [Acinetobacter pittii]
MFLIILFKNYTQHYQASAWFVKSKNVIVKLTKNCQTRQLAENMVRFSKIFFRKYFYIKDPAFV